MSYLISGLDPKAYTSHFTLPEADLAAHGARRIVADADRGYPCRVSLEDARAGERLLLVNHVSNAVDGPYRSAFAIFVRENVGQARYIDNMAPVFRGRPLSLRAYDAAGDLVTARLSTADDAHDPAIRDLLADTRIDHIDAHNAAHGCFAARIDRYRSEA